LNIFCETSTREKVCWRFPEAGRRRFAPVIGTTSTLLKSLNGGVLLPRASRARPGRRSAVGQLHAAERRNAGRSRTACKLSIVLISFVRERQSLFRISADKSRLLVPNLPGMPLSESPAIHPDVKRRFVDPQSSAGGSWHPPLQLVEEVQY
jgi:hypothetical protein